VKLAVWTSRNHGIGEILRIRVHGLGGFRLAMEVMVQNTNLLRESLEKSNVITESMVTILGSFDSRLSTLDSSMRPIQVWRLISSFKELNFVGLSIVPNQT
jgi:hypothetical protein